MDKRRVTPDSFSDGGQFLQVEAAVQHAHHLLDAGAAILDLGAESTRPNATAISAEEEQGRLLPVLEAIRKARPEAILSVDTYHASTASAALAAGAEIINDVSGLTWDPRMAGALAAADPPPGLVLMHTRGMPSEWKRLPRLHPNVVAPLVREELRTRLQAAVTAGIPLDRIVLDPGFGFGKLGPENYPLLARLDALRTLGRPILVGLSRKGFLAHASPSTAAATRLHATVAANTAALLAGAHVLRVHDVAAAVEAAAVADAILASL